MLTWDNRNNVLFYTFSVFFLKTIHVKQMWSCLWSKSLTFWKLDRGSSSRIVRVILNPRISFSHMSQPTNSNALLSMKRFSCSEVRGLVKQVSPLFSVGFSPKDLPSFPHWSFCTKEKLVNRENGKQTLDFTDSMNQAKTEGIPPS